LGKLLMNRKFFEKYGKTLHEKLTGIGATFKFTADNPEQIFLENGYRRLRKISIVEKAVKLELINIPGILLRTLFRTLATGNAVYIFEAR